MRPLFPALAAALALAVAGLAVPLASRMAERRGAVALLELPVGREYAADVAAWRARAEAATPGVPRSWFPVDERFRVVASFAFYETPQVVLLKTTSGATTAVEIPGHLEFEFDRATYRLLPFWPDGGTRMQVLFLDETSGDGSWPEGRVVEADFPGGREAASIIAGQAAEGAIIPPIPIVLDFNMAVNPPCAHDAGGACLLPPAENTLPVAVSAGERQP
ncbi:MAG: DUF1684 domain-containing protein [Vicinamibacterales bacterium]